MLTRMSTSSVGSCRYLGCTRIDLQGWFSSDFPKNQAVTYVEVTQIDRLWLSVSKFAAKLTKRNYRLAVAHPASSKLESTVNCMIEGFKT